MTLAESEWKLISMLWLSSLHWHQSASHVLGRIGPYVRYQLPYLFKFKRYPNLACLVVDPALNSSSHYNQCIGQSASQRLLMGVLAPSSNQFFGCFCSCWLLIYGADFILLSTNCHSCTHWPLLLGHTCSYWSPMVAHSSCHWTPMLVNTCWQWTTMLVHFCSHWPSTYMAVFLLLTSTVYKGKSYFPLLQCKELSSSQWPPTLGHYHSHWPPI